MAYDINVEHIKKLWILDLVIQHNSFKQAALAAKVTPSAVSQTISSLEESMGRILLIRERGTIKPSEVALNIIEIVRPAFEVFDKIKNLNNNPVPQVSWINLGMYESLSVDIIPSLVHSLKEKLPNLRLSLKTSRSSHLISAVRKGELCSAIITESDDLEKFYTQVIGSDTLGFFVSKHHPIAQFGWQAIQKFGYATLSAPKEGLPRYYQRFIKQFQISKPLMTSESFETIRSTTASGALVGLLPHRVALRSSDLIEIHPADSQLKKYKETGEHKILLIAPKNCDHNETEFIAQEAERILKRFSLLTS